MIIIVYAFEKMIEYYTKKFHRVLIVYFEIKCRDFKRKTRKIMNEGEKINENETKIKLYVSVVKQSNLLSLIRPKR